MGDPRLLAILPQSQGKNQRFHRRHSVRRTMRAGWTRSFALLYTPPMDIRSRVAGPGPDRKLLPAFHNLCPLADAGAVVDETLAFLVRRSGNDLMTEKYKISSHCDIRYLLPPDFKHVLLQTAPEHADPLRESSYTEWDEDFKGTRLMEFLRRRFPGAYRTRIAVLPAGGTLSWHIDTNTSVTCRVHIPIYNPGAYFEVKHKGKLARETLQVGQVYFTNTGYPHQAVNPTAENRISVIFGIDFAAIADLMPAIG
jgi:hypothetical protein